MLTAFTKAKDVAIAGFAHFYKSLQKCRFETMVFYCVTNRKALRSTENLSCENIFGFTPLVHHGASHLREEICIQLLVNVSFTQLVFLYIPW